MIEDDLLTYFSFMTNKEEGFMSWLKGSLEINDQADIIPITFKRENLKVSRNDPCPCGSGKKYKKCCLIN